MTRYELSDNMRLKVTVEEVLNADGEDWIWQKQTVILDGEDAARIMEMLSESVKRGAEVDV